MNGREDTHLKSVGYILWIFGFTGSHRFYYGKPISGTIWCVTLGLLLVGWIVDFFLMPHLERQAERRFRAGERRGPGDGEQDQEDDVGGDGQASQHGANLIASSRRNEGVSAPPRSGLPRGRG